MGLESLQISEEDFRRYQDGPKLDVYSTMPEHIPECHQRSILVRKDVPEQLMAAFSPHLAAAFASRHPVTDPTMIEVGVDLGPRDGFAIGIILDWMMMCAGNLKVVDFPLAQDSSYLNHARCFEVATFMRIRPLMQLLDERMEVMEENQLDTYDVKDVYEFFTDRDHFARKQASKSVAWGIMTDNKKCSRMSGFRQKCPDFEEDLEKWLGPWYEMYDSDPNPPNLLKRRDRLDHPELWPEEAKKAGAMP